MRSSDDSEKLVRINSRVQLNVKEINSKCTVKYDKVNTWNPSKYIRINVAEKIRQKFRVSALQDKL